MTPSPQRFDVVPPWNSRFSGAEMMTDMTAVTVATDMVPNSVSSMRLRAATPTSTPTAMLVSA